MIVERELSDNILCYICHNSAAHELNTLQQP